MTEAGETLQAGIDRYKQAVDRTVAEAAERAREHERKAEPAGEDSIPRSQNDEPEAAA